jgi:hypothetical protein
MLALLNAELTDWAVAGVITHSLSGVDSILENEETLSVDWAEGFRYIIGSG